MQHKALPPPEVKTNVITIHPGATQIRRAADPAQSGPAVNFQSRKGGRHSRLFHDSYNRGMSATTSLSMARRTEGAVNSDSDDRLIARGRPDAASPPTSQPDDGSEMTDGLSGRRRQLVMGCILLGVVLSSLDSAIANIAFARKTYTFEFGGSPSAFLDAFRMFYGPTMNAFEAAERDGRAPQLQAELDALFNRQNTSTADNSTRIPATYLEATVRVG